MNMPRTWRTRLLGTCVLFLLPAVTMFAQDSLKVGDLAPQFSLQSATKDSIDFKGITLAAAVKNSRVILAFFPAAWSGGCTKEMCTIRDNFAGLADLGVTVLGISGDYIFTQKEWAKNLGLQFALLSDHDHAVAKAYRTYNSKSGYDVRSIWVIGEKGKIIYTDPAYNVQTPDAFNRLKEALASSK